MYVKNKGITENEILQNQFSAYLKRAVHNRRLSYLINKARKEKKEVDYIDLDLYLPEDTDFVQELADYEAIQQALRSIKEKERYIILARIVEEKSLDQIAVELNMSYKAVTSLYYRVLKKMRLYMDGGGNL